MIFQIYHVFYELWTMSPDGFYGLEDVHFTVLYDLLDARVSGTIDTSTTPAIPENIESQPQI